MGTPTTSDRIANVQVWRDRSFTPGASEPEVSYSIGWGRSGKLEGDPMTREELEALYRLIRQALDEGVDRTAEYEELIDTLIDNKECKLSCAKLPE